MKRLHVHVAVDNLEMAIGFYSTLFATTPSVVKADYAKWMLDDPRVNFAISKRGAKTGLDHLGIQAENGEELEDIGVRLRQADVAVQPQKGASCCYAKSDKYWTIDPQGIAWESFHSLDSVPVFGEDRRIADETKQSACCAFASV